MHFTHVINFLAPKNYKFAGADNATAIRDVWEHDNAAYGEANNIRLETLLAWFSAYPRGGFYLWHGGKIAAGFGLWPLTQEAYSALRDGSLAEDAIGPQHFHQVTPTSPAAYWYLSGFFVEKYYRKSWVLPCLLAKAFARWSRSGNVAPECKLLGFGLTTGGARVMEQLGFSRIIPGRTTLPSFELVIEDPLGIEEMLSRIPAAYAHRFSRL